MNPVRLAWDAMRVRFEIVVFGPSAPDSLAAAEEARDEILRVEASLHPYDPASDLFAVNAAAGRYPVRVLPTTLTFLQRARELSQATDGAFDPTLSGRWDAVAIDVDTGTVALADPTIRLDPGALGKGWALDRAAALLRDAGIRSALLHGGTSSAIALGAPPGEDGWRIALAETASPPLLLCDTALAVSSNRDRPHIVDPRTGAPVAQARLAAAVAPSATDAEALSTALLVLGPAGVSTLTSRFPDARLLLFTG